MCTSAPQKPTCNAHIILVLSKSHFLPKKLVKSLANLRFPLQMLYLDPQTNKKTQLGIIKKREMWKYDLKDWLYDGGEGGEDMRQCLTLNNCGKTRNKPSLSSPVQFLGENQNSQTSPKSTTASEREHFVF